MDIHKHCPLIAQTPQANHGFTYQGLTFNQNSFHIFAGLNAVDNRQNVALTMAHLQRHGLTCTRMGAFKPRTSPYSFQGLGVECLEYVFELAGKYGIKIIAMEITDAMQIEQIQNALHNSGNATGVMLQIGTRNAQNFELLKAAGKQQDFPVLFKRGYGITMEESLTACEYIAYAGNQKIIFCLRGMKSQFAAPHRNFVDFAHVSAIKRLTRLPVCVDPSHSVGNNAVDLDSISDVYHVTAQGIIAGANMLLVDIHPQPHTALVDAQQAIALHQLELYLEDISICRETYLMRKKLHNTKNEVIGIPTTN